jgi:hypothetical protein
MTDVTVDVEAGEVAVGAKGTVDDGLVAELVARARAGGVKLTGEGGLLQQLTKRVLESALEGELTDHLGHEPGERAEGGRENCRNGHRSKTVITESGPVEVAVPRDRAGSFEPQLVKKRQRRLGGVDEMVLSLSAKGLTRGEISAHLAEVYGAQVSKSTISTIIDSVMAGMTEWQNRPLDRVYPVVFIDCVNVKVRDGHVANRPVCMAVAVTAEGHRDILGLWIGDGGEGAKYWLQVLTEIKNRGAADVLMLVCDGPTGLPDAVNTVWPATIVQTCVVHRSRTETRCRFRQRASLIWYGVFGGGARSTRRAVRDIAAASGRAAAASAAGGRGEAAGAWRCPRRRAGRGGKREHGPQGCLRAGGGRGSTARWPYSQVRRGSQAGRGGRSGSAACVDGTGRAG